MSVPSDLKLIENTPITFAQIQSIVAPSVRKELVMRELDKLPKNCQTKDIFGGKRFCALYCARWQNGKQTAAHWCCLIKQKSRFVFFDSLGHTPLALTHLLNSPKKSGFLTWTKKNHVSSSTTKLQNKYDQDCGDHIAVRLTKSDLSSKQYVKWIKSFHLNTDHLVSLMVFTQLLPRIR